MFSRFQTDRHSMYCSSEMLFPVSVEKKEECGAEKILLVSRLTRTTHNHGFGIRYIKGFEVVFVAVPDSDEI